MREISYAEGIREALREEMLMDMTVFLLGEDIGVYGGMWKCTRGLLAEFGEERVRDTPISESAIIGVSIGAASMGMRPVAEIQFADLLPLCMDQIVNQAAKLRYLSGGQIKIPLVIRVPQGAGRSGAAQHSQCIESWFVHVPGLKIAIPSTPYDAKGLLKTAIRDGNPTIFFEHKMLYGVKGPVPKEEYAIPFGVADIKREGEDITIVATSLMVHSSLEAAEKLEGQGIDVEVIDPRTLFPLDKRTIVDSVKKTGRLVVVEEACKTGGVGGEISSIVIEEAFDYLDAPPQRVATPDIPIPFSPPLEMHAIPSTEKIINAVKSLV